MNKIIIGGIAVVVIVAGWFGFRSNDADTATTTPTEVSTTTPEEATSTPVVVPTAPIPGDVKG